MTTSSNTIEIRLTTPGSAEAVQALRVVRGAIADLDGRGGAAMREIADSAQSLRVDQVEGFETHIHELGTELEQVAVTARETEDALGKAVPPEAGRDVDGLNDKLERTEQQLGKVSGAARDIGMALSVGITVPVMALGGAALKTEIDVEQAMAGVRKTTDLTAVELRALSEDFKALSERPGRPAHLELLEIAAGAGQLGIQTPNIREFTETISALRVSTNLLGEQGTQDLARFANITQMPQTEFDRLGSTVVSLGNKLATTEAEVVDMGLRIAGAGHQIGMTEAQILGVAGALSSVGIASEAGGTAISRVMADMASAVASGGDELERFAKVAGMGSSEFQQLFREDSAEAVIRFIEGIRRLSDEGENVFAVLESVEFADIRVRDALLRAAGAGDLLRRSIHLGSEAWEENIALTKEADQFYNTAGGDLRAFLNTVRNLTGELGSALVPAFRDGLTIARAIIVPVRELVELFGELPAGIRLVAVGMAGLAAATGPTVWILGNLVESFTALVISGPAAVKVLRDIRAAQAGAAITGTAASLTGLGTVAAVGGPVLLGLGAVAAVLLTIKENADDSAEAVRKAQEDYVARIPQLGRQAAFTEVENLESQLSGLRNAAGQQLRSKLDFTLAHGEDAPLTRNADRTLQATLGRIRQVEEALTAARARLSELSSIPGIVVGGGGGGGGGGNPELEALQARASTLTSLYESLTHRGEDTSVVFAAILQLNREIERSIRAQGAALTDQRATLLGLSGNLDPVLNPRIELDLERELRGLSAFRLPTDFESEERDRQRHRLAPWQTTGPERDLATRVRGEGITFGHGFVGQRIPKKDKDLDAAGKEFDQAASVAISALGGMAQAAITGTAEMERVVIQGFASIAQAAVSQANPVLGTAIGVVGGLLGSLFSRRESGGPTPVKLEEYGSRALSQRRENNGPEIVQLLVVAPDTGEILAQTDYDLRRREKRDAIVRIPTPVRYG